MAEKAVILELTGDQDKLARFVKMLNPFGIVEMMRTGRVAMARTE